MRPYGFDFIKERSLEIKYNCSVYYFLIFSRKERAETYNGNMNLLNALLPHAKHKLSKCKK